MSRFPFLLGFSLLLPSLAGAAPVQIERARYLMGTTLALTLEGESAADLQRAADAAFDEVARLDDILSNWQRDSEVSQLNAHADSRARSVVPELAEVLASSLEWTERTGGAFDAVVEPLVALYDLRGSGRWPEETERAAALHASGARHLRLDPTTLTAALEPGAGVELGGIGKGYALDRAASVLRQAGVEAALLDFGGQVLALGAPQGARGWSVVLAGPTDREGRTMRLLLRDASLATSAQTERALPVDGRLLGHVLDPRTGRPVPDWGSVSAVATSATDADAASTALFVMGPEQGARWIAENPGIAALFQTLDATGTSQTRLAGEHGGLLAATDAGPRPAGAPPSNAELARRIDLLAEELEELQQGEVAAPSASRFGLAPGASRVYSAPRGPSIAGYGEAVFTHYSESDESGAVSNKKDQVDFLRLVTYLGYKFSDKILFNSEIEFEHASTGRDGEVSVEFGYLDFLIGSGVNARAGMLLLPVGWLNELHEPPVYLGVSRTETERVILPSTWRGNGVGLFGELASGISYRAYLVEGLRAVRDTVEGFSGYSAADGIRGGRQSGGRAIVENWAGTARVDWHHALGLTVGASVVSGGSAQGITANGQPMTARTTSWDAHGEYRTGGAWLRALYAETRVDEVDLVNAAGGLSGSSSVGSKMGGWYAQAAYDVLRLWRDGGDRSLYAFLRYEWVDTQREVPTGYARSLKNEREFVTLGASFYPHPQVALKTDYQWRSNGTRTEVDRLQLAVTYLF